jgi:hypothetical protein
MLNISNDAVWPKKVTFGCCIYFELRLGVRNPKTPIFGPKCQIFLPNQLPQITFYRCEIDETVYLKKLGSVMTLFLVGSPQAIEIDIPPLSTKGKVLILSKRLVINAVDRWDM